MTKHFLDTSDGGTATLTRQDWAGDSGSIETQIPPSVTSKIEWDVYGRQFRQYLRGYRLTAQRDMAANIEKINSAYATSGISEIKNFLEENQAVVSVLLDAPNAVRSVFGDSAVLSLELQSDPEEGGRELFIKVGNDLTRPEALRLENRLFEEWFIEKIDQVAGKLNFCETKNV